MDIYIASTPYNLFNCINHKLNLNKNNKADLIVYDIPVNNFVFAKKLEKEKIFEHIYYFSKTEDFLLKEKGFFKRKNWLIKKEFGIMFCYKKLFNKYCKAIGMNGDQVYENAFFDIPSMIARFIFNYYLSRNRKLKYYSIEPGLEAYLTNNALSFTQKILRHKMDKRCYGNYVYEPTIANSGNALQLPKIDKNNKHLTALYNRVFNYRQNKKFENEKIIFFDQSLDAFPVINKLQTESVNVMKKHCSNFCIKLHPRRVNKKIYDNLKKYKMNNGFEMNILNGSKYEEKILITSFSISVFLPKIMFDEEPTIICLIPYFYEHFGEGKEVLLVVKKLLSIYRDKSKVFLPSTQNDFETYLKTKLY